MFTNFFKKTETPTWERNQWHWKTMDKIKIKFKKVPFYFCRWRIVIQKCPGKTLQMLDMIKKIIIITLFRLNVSNHQPTSSMCPSLLSDMEYSCFFFFPLHSDADSSVACLPPSQSQNCIVSAVPFFLNGLFLGRKRFLVSCIRELKCVNMYLGQLQWPHLVGVYWIWNGLRHCKRVLCKSFSTMFQRKTIRPFSLLFV